VHQYVTSSFKLQKCCLTFVTNVLGHNYHPTRSALVNVKLYHYIVVE